MLHRRAGQCGKIIPSPIHTLCHHTGLLQSLVALVKYEKYIDEVIFSVSFATLEFCSSLKYSYVHDRMYTCVWVLEFFLVLFLCGYWVILNSVYALKIAPLLISVLLIWKLSQVYAVYSLPISGVEFPEVGWSQSWEVMVFFEFALISWFLLLALRDHGPLVVLELPILCTPSLQIPSLVVPHAPKISFPPF